MKKSILALITLAALGSTSAMVNANESTKDFIWTGEVPKVIDSSTDKGWLITAADSTTLTGGTLEFSNDGSTIKFLSSDEIKFYVQTLDADNIPNGTYSGDFNMIVNSRTLRVNGLIDAHDNVNGYDLMVDGTSSADGIETKSNVSDSDPVVLHVSPVDAGADLDYLDEDYQVSYTANITVTPDTL